MKTYLVLLIAFFSIVSHSQEKSIIIHKTDTDRSKEIMENKRIKVVTADGTKHWGRFTVVDASHIMINEKVIPLDSIVKIRRKSLGGTIILPVLIVYGSVYVAAGAAVYVALVGSSTATVAAIAGGAVAAPGVALIVIPSTPNNHPKDRTWEYTIKYNNENSPNPSPISLGEAGTQP